MTITRSFGTVFTFPGGMSRQWYAGSDGIERWMDGTPRHPITPADADFIAAMSAGLPPIHAPRGLDEMSALECAEGICAEPIQSDNTDIAVSESAYFPLTAEQLAEGDITAERL